MIKFFGELEALKKPVFALLLTVIAIFAFSRMIDIADAEPDLFFNLYLAKTSAERGIVTTIPQIEDLGWGKAYPEKNFLFIQLLSLSYKLGGTRLVLLTPPLLGLLLLILLFYLSPMPRTLPAMIVVLLLLAVPAFSHRLVLLRPHVLAILLFTVIYFAMYHQRPWIAFFSTLLFALAYHAYYLPLFLIGASMLAKKGRGGWVELGVVFGLAAGILLNPYFPQNLAFSWTNITIALTSSINPETVPSELLRMPAREFFPRYLVFLIAIPIGLISVLRGDDEKTNKSAFAFLLISTALFWVLTFKSHRAIEYSAVLGVSLIASLLARTTRPKVIGSLFCIVFLLSYGARAYQFYRYAPENLYNTEAIFEALRAIPADAAGAKVLNVEWETGPYILYSRPDLRFVDVWGPYLLEEKRSDLHQAREALRTLSTTDPTQIVRDIFHARFVLLQGAALARRLEGNANFRRLYPYVPGTASIYLYEVTQTAGSTSSHWGI